MTGIILETARLTLRLLTPDDREAISEILQDSRVMYAYEGAFTDEMVQAWLDRQLQRYTREGCGLWAVISKETGSLIGQCGVTLQQIPTGTVHEVGYLFRYDHWHKGYASEAALACRDYAFDALDAPKVYAIIRDSNIPSQRVAMGMGMKPEGSFTKHYRGVEMPHIIFSVTGEERDRRQETGRQEAGICTPPEMQETSPKNSFSKHLGQPENDLI